MGKVLMIGLDGATFDLLLPLMEQGFMPTLKKIVDNGVHGDLMSTRNPLTPPAWTSMITGRSPHVHGIYDFLRPTTLEDGSVFLHVNDSRDCRAETLWSIASRQDKRITSLNFYGHSPAAPVNGYLASGFVPWKHLRHGMYPSSLLDMVKGLPGFDYKNLAMDIGEEKKCVQGLLEGEHEDWIKLQQDRDTAWADLCVHLTETAPSDITALVMDGPDKIQHLFWRFVAPDLVQAPGDAWYDRIRSLCLDYYRGLDRNIQRLIEAAGPETTVVMTSDHGFGATTEIVYINEWLARKGYLKWSDEAAGDATGQLTANKIKDHLGMIDWKNTLAFSPTPSSNAIYIKRAKGNGKGVRAEEYLDFCLKLKQELQDYRDPATGEQVFVQVDLNKLEGTPYVEPSPDVTLHLRDGGFVSILKSDEIVVPRKHPDGTHRPNGIFIAYGPGIKSGVRIDPLQIVDITPLLLHVVGLPVPADMEGRVPTEIFADAGQKVAQGERTVSQGMGKPRAEATAEEREALLRQMQLLGYMD